MLAQSNKKRNVNMAWLLKVLACDCAETKIMKKVINSESVSIYGMNTPYIIIGRYRINYHLLYTSQSY